MKIQKPRKLERSLLPKALFEIPQPPENLWILGELPKGEDLVYLSVVGSRKFTSYGREACERLIAGLAGYPIVIVSGFAMGIDTIAHKSAMKAGLYTMVFPGSGLSKSAIFPKTNVGLIDEILRKGNCFISEYEPDTKATHFTFPERNRLMAGISKAVLVIEGEERSGTLITARLTVEYNRDLLAVPGSIFSPNSKGTNRLIREGATPITSSEDLLDALGFDQSEKKMAQNKLFEDLSPEEKSVLKLLREPMSKDDLIRAMGKPVAEANTIISIMEIKELIKEELGEIRRT